MRGRTALLVAVLLLLAQVPLQAAIYKWVDKNGTVCFGDSPPPSEKALKAKPIAPKPVPRVPVPSPTADLPPLPEDPPAVADEAPAPKVELYTTSWCGYCKQAKAFLRSQGIAYTEYDVEQDREAAQRMRQLTHASSVPVAVIDGQVIRGFSEGAYRQALGL